MQNSAVYMISFMPRSGKGKTRNEKHIRGLRVRGEVQCRRAWGNFFGALELMCILIMMVTLLYSFVKIHRKIC